MKPRLFLETTIPSDLVARPSRDLIVAACQRVTREWWDSRRELFDLYVSRLVLEEASAGDPEPASQRLGLLRDIAVLDVDDRSVELAERLMIRLSLPPKARLDSFHIAVSAVNGMEYLLTWNCKHIANATLQDKIGSVCRNFGVRAPVIRTPFEFLEGPDDAA